VGEPFYKIGELAQLTDISVRTIDFYTSIGIIQPVKRTPSNYRLYSDETILRLKRIEQLKKAKYTLEEIKAYMKQYEHSKTDVQVAEKLAELQLHMKQLEQEVKELQPIIENLKTKSSKPLLNNLTAQSAACIEALLLILSKGPML
jgi:MerR family copper efflux transcriptional regulator